jgi:CheY-like chemotaxis protein
MVLKTLENYSENQNAKSLYSIILCDLNMPISDGFDACSKIRRLYDKDTLITWTNSREQKVTGTIQLREIQPFIVAWTSENLANESLLERLDQAGFDAPIESPIILSKV